MAVTAGGEAARRLTLKLNTLLGKEVVVILKNGVVYRGRLAGLDYSNLTLALENAERNDPQTHSATEERDQKQPKSVPLAIISGSSISEIILSEAEVFDANEFAEFLAKYGGISRHLIIVHTDSNIVEVARSVRVSRSGVLGSGPMAQKIHTLWKEYLRRKGVEV